MPFVFISKTVKRDEPAQNVRSLSRCRRRGLLATLHHARERMEAARGVLAARFQLPAAGGSAASRDSLLRSVEGIFPTIAAKKAGRGSSCAGAAHRKTTRSARSGSALTSPQRRYPSQPGSQDLSLRIAFQLNVESLWRRF